MNRAALVVTVLLASAGFVRCVSAADVVLFDGAYENGTKAYSSTVTIDTTDTDPLAGGEASLQLVAAAKYGQLGIAGGPKIPATDPYIRMDVNFSQLQTLFIAENYTGYTADSLATAYQYFTVDGVAATSTTISTINDGKWHTVAFDYAAAFPAAFAAGAGINYISVQNSNTTIPNYLANIVFTDSPTLPSPVPEPASLGLLAVGALALLRRRRA